MTRSRVAAVGLLLGGLAMILGTVLPWSPQGGPFRLITGLEHSEGAAMIVLGVLLSLVGADALRRGGSSPFWAVGVAAGGVAVFALAPRFDWSGYLSVAEFLEWGPAYGLYLVMAGAVTGVVAGLGVRQPSRTDALQTHPKRPAALIGAGGVLVVAGSVLPWAIGDVLSSGASFIGVETIEGLATFLMGLVLGVTGLMALVSRDRPWTRPVAAILGLVCLVIVAYVFATLAQRLEGWDQILPGGGLYAVTIGSVLALIGVSRIARDIQSSAKPDR